jgi:hypothetical protein
MGQYQCNPLSGASQGTSRKKITTMDERPAATIRVDNVAAPFSDTLCRRQLMGGG